MIFRRKESIDWLKWMYRLYIVFAIALLVLAASAPFYGVDTDGATRILTQQGYTQVEITGYRWFVGGQGDYYHTGFHAISPTGISITGTVTKGLFFKASTIRFD